MSCPLDAKNLDSISTDAEKIKHGDRDLEEKRDDFILLLGKAENSGQHLKNYAPFFGE